MGDARRITDDHTQWFVVQLKPNGLNIARRNLERQSIVTFSPSVETTVQRQGKFVEERKPLFAGYLFVSANQDATPWRAINSTYGVCRLVTFGHDKAPRTVPPGLMAALMARCDTEGVFRDAPQFGLGDQVAITKGPFASFTATVTRLSSQERVWLLLDILGRETQVVVSRAHLEAV